MNQVVIFFILVFIILWIYKSYQIWNNSGDNSNNNSNNNDNIDKNKCINIDITSGQVINYNLWKNHYYPPSWDKKLCTPANFNGTYRQLTNNMPIDQTMSPSLQKHYNQPLMTADVAPFFVQCRRANITGQVLIGKV